MNAKHHLLPGPVLTSLLAMTSLMASAEAAIILSDNAGFAEVTFTDPITFQATSPVGGAPTVFFGLIAEDYFTADTSPVNGNPTSGGITTSNGASTIASVISTNSPTLNLYDRNDFLITFRATSNIEVGDFITFGASSFVSDIPFASLPGVNATTSVTMTDNFNQGISGSQVVAIPEPSATILAGIGALSLLGARRRAQRAA